MGVVGEYFIKSVGVSWIVGGGGNTEKYFARI